MKEKKLNIEVIRIVAIMSTIMIHVSNIYMRSFSKISKLSFFGSTFFNSCARICVPLFFMISGALLINGEYNKKKYFKRIGKFILILAVWSIIYFAINVYRGGSSNIIKAICWTFFDTSYTSKHLWFMYAIIGLYIALPFVQTMCKNLTKEQENLFLILWFVISGLSGVYLPIMRLIGGYSLDIVYPVPLINGAYYLGYFICGHIIYKRIKDIKANKKYNTICILTYLLLALFMSVITYIVSVEANKLVTFMLWYRSIFIVFESISIFVLIIINGDKFKNENIIKISSLSFGVYLVHAIILFLIKDNISIINYPSIIGIPIITLIIYFSTLLIVYILKKIPVVKELL